VARRRRETPGPTKAFEAAERQLFAACRVKVTARRVRLADPPLGPRAAELAPDGFFATVHEGMRQPQFRTRW